MKPRLNRFILISIFIHLIVLMLFSMNDKEILRSAPLTIDISFSRSSASSLNNNSRSKSESRLNANNNRSRSSSRNVKESSSKKTSQVQRSSPTTSSKSSSKKENTRRLIRNTPPSSPRRLQNYSDQKSKEDSFKRQITLDKSKEIIRGSRSSAPEHSSGQDPRPEGGSSADFGEKSVFNKSSSSTRSSSGISEGNGSRSSPSTSASSGSPSGGSSKGKSSQRGDHGFNWKGTGQRRLEFKNELAFPKELEGRGIDEEVVIAFKVSPDGKVYEIELIKSSGYSKLDNAVKEQVRSFRFNGISSNKVSEAEYSYLFKLEKK